MVEHDTTPPETIHEEIEREIAGTDGMAAHRRLPILWKALVAILIVGAGVWLAWPRPSAGPIHAVESDRLGKSGG